MLAFVAAGYLLLALRVRLRAEAALGGKGALSITISFTALELRLDGEIVRKKEGIFLQLTPRYGKAFERSKKKQAARLRAALSYLSGALRSGRMERAELQMRVGLEGAGETALAAGALRAAVLSALSFADAKKTQVSIWPEFGGACFSAYACCIFSCPLGDIMTAVIKAAVKKTGKEGFWWKSIPLRA